jgi:hypothetical protein
MNSNWVNDYSAWRIADLQKDVANVCNSRLAAVGTKSRPAKLRRFWQFGRGLFAVRRRRQEGSLPLAPWRVPWRHGTRLKSAMGDQ